MTERKENAEKTKKKKKVQESNFIFMKKTPGEKVVHTIFFIIFAAWALSYLLPLLWLLVQSLHDAKMYNYVLKKQGMLAFPSTLHLENYIKAFTTLNYDNTDFLGMLFNSLWFLAIAETWCLFWPIMVGYIFAKYNFKGKEPFHALIIFTLTVPIMGSTGAYFKLVDFLNIYNTGPLFVIVTGVGGFSSGFLIYYGIFKGISWSYAESVFIDGGGNFTAFWHVMLPQAMPAISAMMVTGMIAHWNEYYQFLLYLPSWPTVATGLYKINIEVTAGSSEVQKPHYYAALVISMIPVLILYGFMAESMMKNLSIGGLKG